MHVFKGIVPQFFKQVLVLSLVSILSLLSIFSLTITASYAQIPLNSQETGLTKEELTKQPKNAPLSNEEKIDRAYTYGESAGMREEAKIDQEELADKARNPRMWKNTEPKDQGLIEKAQELIENVTGQ